MSDKDYREQIARRCDELLNARISWPAVIECVKVEFHIASTVFVEDCYNEWIDGE